MIKEYLVYVEYTDTIDDREQAGSTLHVCAQGAQINALLRALNDSIHVYTIQVSVAQPDPIKGAVSRILTRGDLGYVDTEMHKIQ